MKFELPPLPYEKDALDPHISARTLEFHYEKHHRGYMDKLRAAIEGKPEGDGSLEDLVRSAKGGVFNNAAQVWNHSFYWQSLKPDGGGNPTGPLAEAVNRDFGSAGELKSRLAEIASGHFGSGWGWLVLNSEGKLEAVATHDAGNPMQNNQTPLLTIDVWEHAYYLDYQNARPKYVQAVIDHLLNWDFAAQNLARKRP